MVGMLQICNLVSFTTPTVAMLQIFNGYRKEGLSPPLSYLCFHAFSKSRLFLAVCSFHLLGYLEISVAYFLLAHLIPFMGVPSSHMVKAGVLVKEYSNQTFRGSNPKARHVLIHYNMSAVVNSYVVFLHIRAEGVGGYKVFL